MTNLSTNTPIVREALAALGAFGPMDKQTASELLAMWSRADDLTGPEGRAVLGHYPSELPGGDGLADVGGFAYPSDPQTEVLPAPYVPGPDGEHRSGVPMCAGAPAGFEADCGWPGPHGTHPLGGAR